jgi:hypothetical protein
VGIRRACIVVLLAAAALVSSPAAGQNQDFVLICVPNFGGKLVPWGCRYADQAENGSADRAYGLATPVQGPVEPRIAKKKSAHKGSVAKRDQRRSD